VKPALFLLGLALLRCGPGPVDPWESHTPPRCLLGESCETEPASVEPVPAAEPVPAEEPTSPGSPTADGAQPTAEQNHPRLLAEAGGAR
jgi:hypothetical protein